MRKILVSILVSVMVLSGLTGCVGQPANKNASTATQTSVAATSEPTPSPTATPSPVSEPDAFAPVDIFGSELNPFYDVAFPQNFDIYGASFFVGDPKVEGIPKFVLSMTAEGATDEAIAFLVKWAGMEGTDSINKYIDDYHNYEFCEFQSIDGVICTIRKTNPNDDRYTYVEGCHIDLCIDVASLDSPKYIPLVSDNFNINALSVAADYFDVTPDLDQCGIYVNLHKNSAEIYVVYDVPDVSAVEQKMAEEVAYNWYDPDSGKMGLSYGMIDVSYLFDHLADQLYMLENSTAVQTAVASYTPPEVSLTTLGFNYAETDALCTYEDKNEGFMIAIHQPAWGSFVESWNLEYLHEVNGYLLAVWYYADAQMYTVQADKDGSSAKYDYYIQTGEYGNEWSTSDTARDRFCTVFDTQDDDVYAKAIGLFEQKTQDLFGMSPEDLYALPAR